MKVCILGWYGTETIGDRAILVGIYSFLLKSFDNLEIKLGSLYPFYSKRMIDEDKSLYREALKKEINIELFNSRNKAEVDRYLEESELIIMGGGPMMHINELFMIEYAFKRAKKLKKKTGIIGCGIGPLFEEKYKRSAINIVRNSDIVVLRDEKSKEYLDRICAELKYDIEKKDIKVSFDPAVECAIKYLENCKKPSSMNDEIIVNLREFPGDYSKENDKDRINNLLEKFIVDLSHKFKDKKIRLIPMHYFAIGDDDRAFLNMIKLKNDLPNVFVQNEIMSLQETMDTFYNAELNIGMRFHSVVLQTILSGKNYIMDYTEPNIGKISGFIIDIDKVGFYKDRFISLQSEKNINIDKFSFENCDEKFVYDSDKVKLRLDTYCEQIRRIYNEK